MRIAIIDADLIGRKRHRFPNLACMKLSGYYKEQGHDVTLELSYDKILDYDKVFISKVFTDTPINEEYLSLPNVEYGGTGFFFDKAPNLPYEIEHHFPDYHLYDEWVEDQFSKGVKKVELKEYTDYSIGFLTRGCFRKCGFCVNKKYNHVFKHSPLEEFYDPSRKKICLLDDNFFGCPKWREMFEELIKTGKPFKFKQGMDERILTEEKIKLLFDCRYDGDLTFAFDDIDDYKLIEEKLKLIRKHSDKRAMFYVLCGYDKNNKYDEDFWKNDLINTFKRIELLGKYKAFPYIMRFEKYKESPYRGMYVTLARWCNQPAFFKKQDLYTFIHVTDGKSQSKEMYASKKYYEQLKEIYPDVIKQYFFTNYWTGDKDDTQ